MPNTFLNTGRTVRATSNPQANVQQVQPVNAQTPTNPVQPVQNNNTTQSSTNNQTQSNNAINPITIPIQIQPTVANQPQQAQVEPRQNLQVQQASNPAPTPQTYQEPQYNNNVIDFNQIYSSYQSAFGNNNNSNTNSTGASGIKKTSIGTTIVTPTTANLNSVEGMYQSSYANTINSLLSEMITQLENGFTYDPNKDNALKVATEYAANSTMQSLAGSGVLNSSATAERVARVVSELIPQYEQLAYTRWTDYVGQLSDTAQLVMNYDSQQFEYWKDAKDREFQNKQFEYQKQQDALENAWKRVDELGYVDNNASAILGVPVGTLSGEARLAKEQREFELAKMREQAQIEYENNKALYQLKAELDKDQARYAAELQKEQAKYESELSKNETKYTYELEKEYGGSSSSRSSASTTSLSTYQDIINNRWADYDEFSRKYTVNDNAGLYNYLVSEYSAGRMSSSDLANLTAMYNVTQPTDADIARAERIKWLNSLQQ